MGHYAPTLANFKNGNSTVQYTPPVPADPMDESMLRYAATVCGYSETSPNTFSRTNVASVQHYWSDVIDHSFQCKWVAVVYFHDPSQLWDVGALASKALTLGFKLQTTHHEAPFTVHEFVRFP